MTANTTTASNIPRVSVSLLCKPASSSASPEGASAQGDAPARPSPPTTGFPRRLAPQQHSSDSLTVPVQHGTTVVVGRRSVVEKPTSSFVARIVAHESLARYLFHSQGTYLLYGCGRSFVWMDYAFQPNEPLTVIHFREGHVTCHAIKPGIQDTLDVVLGFTGGDVLFYSPVSGKYTRVNRNGALLKRRVTCITWVPDLVPHRVLVGFEDGWVMVLHAEREDGQLAFPARNVGGEGEESAAPTTIPHLLLPVLPPTRNPEAVWTLASRPITSLGFQPQGGLVAVTCASGELFLLDAGTWAILDIFSSWFGGLLCHAWSPDGKYLCTGGEDDLVSVWHVGSRSLVARCQGHHAWVTGLRFDPAHCHAHAYRFLSVGEDAHLLVWEFDPRGLHKPRPLTVRRRTRHRGSTLERAPSVPLPPGVGAGAAPPSGSPPSFTRHPVLTMHEVPVLLPLADAHVQLGLLTDVLLAGDALVTVGTDPDALHIWKLCRDAGSDPPPG